MGKNGEGMSAEKMRAISRLRPGWGSKVAAAVAAIPLMPRMAFASYEGIGIIDVIWTATAGLVAIVLMRRRGSVDEKKVEWYVPLDRE